MTVKQRICFVDKDRSTSVECVNRLLEEKWSIADVIPSAPGVFLVVLTIDVEISKLSNENDEIVEDADVIFNGDN